MELLPNEEDFACFIDGDACFTTTYFGKQLEDIIVKYPSCGLFSSVASRAGCIWQRAGNPDIDNIRVHREIGLELQTTKYDAIKNVSHVHPMHVLSGHLILISKKVWRKLGGFKEAGILGVDNDIHWKAMAAGEKVYLMEGVYLYHYYRNDSKCTTNNTGHLI
jgi:GT2 family glycosyltransferase